MKDVTDDFKLSARSTAEITEAFTALVSTIARTPEIRYLGKKPPRGAVLNALVMWATSLTKDEQQAVIARGMELLNAHLEEREPAAPGTLAEPEAPPAPKRRKA